MKELFDSIIKNTVKPLLSDNRFRKKALYFYCQKDDLIFIIHFQKSQYNHTAHTRFYINCGIHSLAIDKTLSKAGQTEPDKIIYCYSKRISEIINSTTDGYDITEDTDLNALSNKLTNDLNSALQFFDTVATTDALVNLMIQENGLYNYEELVEYLFVTNNEKELHQYVNALYTRFGSENRWAIFEKKMNDIFIKYNSRQTVSELINNCYG